MSAGVKSCIISVSTSKRREHLSQLNREAFLNRRAELRQRAVCHDFVTKEFSQSLIKDLRDYFSRTASLEIATYKRTRPELLE